MAFPDNTCAPKDLPSDRVCVCAFLEYIGVLAFTLLARKKKLFCTVVDVIPTPTVCLI